MKFDLNQKNILVTGGGSGIGKAISLALSQQGATVFVLDFNEENGKKTVSEIKKEGNKGFFYHCNVSISQEVEDIISTIAKAYDISALVNNAGIGHVGNIEQTQEEDLDRLYQVNIKGIYNCARAVIKHMKIKGGVIINMASIASSVGVSERFAYSMSKGAVLTMSYSIAKDYLLNGIRCNSISPARISTPFVEDFIAKNYAGREKEIFQQLSKSQPLGRMGLPEEVAHLVLYLCSEEASFITGTDFPIDGGFIKLNG